MTERRFLFVAGCQRSGTTILGRILNRHPDVAIGVERYKYLFSRAHAGDITPELFSEKRFFDFRADDTNIKAPHEYERLKNKFHKAVVVGDKFPRLYRYYPKLFKAFPDCRLIYILRKVENVAASWQVRAHDSEDRWPEKNDYKVAVEAWNLANQQTAKWIKKKPEAITIVEYEKLLSGNELYLGEMLDRVELSMNMTLVKAYRAFTKDWSTRVNRPLNLDASQQQFIAENADAELYRSLLIVARKQRSDSHLTFDAVVERG